MSWPDKVLTVSATEQLMFSGLQTLRSYPLGTSDCEARRQSRMARLESGC